jgi:biopolymer transport protein ExbD
MAGVQPQATGKGGGKTALGLRKRKRVGVGIDMTPMVDVAFLLLIFFMVTTVRVRWPSTCRSRVPRRVKESERDDAYVANRDHAVRRRPARLNP